MTSVVSLDDKAEAPAEHPGPWNRTQRLTGFAVHGVLLAISVISALAAGIRIYEDYLRITWQLLPLDALRDDPFGSVWYLHTQPPLHNLLVGTVLRWSPFPEAGTLLVLYLACFCLLGLVLTDLLAKQGLHPVAAGLVAGVAVANLNLLLTISVVSYEIPVATLIVGSLWWFQRHLQQPSTWTLVGLSATLTALTLTRSLFHPAFVLLLVLLAAVARRVSARQVAIALAIPVVLVGGWMVKNQVLFGTSSTSSWLGFNLQRGVIAPMARDQVQADVADGHVTGLALEGPWGPLTQYQAFAPPCRPSGRHEVLSVEQKYPGVDNFNHECYLPLYSQSVDNALALLRRHPARYLRNRATVLAYSFNLTPVVTGELIFGTQLEAPHRSWLAVVPETLLVPVEMRVGDGDWNLPLFGGIPVSYQLSPVLVVLFLLVVGRGVVGLVRALRRGWGDREQAWSTADLVWVAAVGMVLVTVVVSALLEFGENGRFRTMVDPLLLALPAGAGLRWLGRQRWFPWRGLSR